MSTTVRPTLAINTKPLIWQRVARTIPILLYYAKAKIILIHIGLISPRKRYKASWANLMMITSYALRLIHMSSTKVPCRKAINLRSSLSLILHSLISKTLTGILTKLKLQRNRPMLMIQQCTPQWSRDISIQTITNKKVLWAGSVWQPPNLLWLAEQLSRTTRLFSKRSIQLSASDIWTLHRFQFSI